jgi:predicted TIM-barrel fold metal-dependent hydrolase
MGLVDCHFHVIAPLDDAPMTAQRSYTPAPASLADWRATLEPLGVTHGVVVQPSVYGTDNQVLMAALRQGEGQVVGVAAVDAEVSDDELDRLAAAGVRGVRMAYFEPGDPRAVGGFVPFAAFEAIEHRLAGRGLHLQLFTDSRLLPAIERRLAASLVPVVIDHMGRAPAHLGASHAGIAALMRLMREGPVWVKLSGIANVSAAAPHYDDARAVHHALLEAAPHRLVWGSDWPHTRPGGARPSTRSLVDLFRRWTPGPRLDQVATRNAVELYRLGAG